MEFSKGGERFTMTNLPLGALILVAYDITVRQLSGPGEFLSQRYDISARTEHPVEMADRLRMLQALLADRFSLTVRRERKVVPVYALAVGKHGPKLRESEPTEGAVNNLHIPSRVGGAEVRGGYVFRNESMDDFAWALSRMAGIGDRVVVDGTGLNGTYDFELMFDRDGAAARENPSIFTALEEQLGLKLESKKAPVEFLVVDHLERPSEN